MAVESTSGEQLDVAIVGGGIAGLTLTACLLKYSHVRVTIYEAAHHFGEVGAGVAFGPNATRAMQLIHPDLWSGFEKVATRAQWPSKEHIWFDMRFGQDMPDIDKKTGDLLIALECEGGQATCRRDALLDELVKLVPEGAAHFGKRVVGLHEVENGIDLDFADGTHAHHDAVVGCDGIKSEVRQYVLGRDHPAAHAHFSGKYCHRALIPMDAAVEVMGDELARNNNGYLGTEGHVLTFPVQKGAMMNLVAFKSKADGRWDDAHWVVPSSVEEIEEDFKSFGPKVRALLKRITKTDTWALFDDPPAPTYSKGPVCVSGDAAHASTTNQGAGAGMAVEDAFVLGSLIGAIDSVAGLEQAFKAYDSVRRQRTQNVVVTSRQAGHLWAGELEGVGWDVDKIGENAKDRMRWIWDEDLEKEVQTGKQMISL